MHCFKLWKLIVTWWFGLVLQSILQTCWVNHMKHLTYWNYHRKLLFFGWTNHKKVTSIRFTCSMNLGQWSRFGPVRQQAFRADLITFNSIGNGLSWSLAQSLLSELRYFNVQKDLSSFISMEIPWWHALEKLTFMRTLGLSGGRVGWKSLRYNCDEIDIFLWQHQVPKAQELMNRTWKETFFSCI